LGTFVTLEVEFVYKVFGFINKSFLKGVVISLVMKTVFIPTKAEVELSVEDVSMLPDKVGVVMTAQFVDLVSELKKKLEESGKQVFVGKGKQEFDGQVLGCDVSAALAVKEKVDCILYVGDGKFHPIEIGLNIDKKVFCFNPFSGKIVELDISEVDRVRKRRKGGFVKFMSSKIVGIMVCSKKGQCKLELVDKIKEKYLDKEFYTFYFDTLNISDLENFPFIECYVNTACPRICDDESEKAIVDARDVLPKKI